MIFPKSWYNQIKGQAMVELAFVIFIVVTFAFGITEFGRAMYTKNTLTNAARAGARQAVVTQGLTVASSTTLTLSGNNCNYNNPSGNDLIYQAVCSSLYSGIDKSQVNVTIESKDSSNNTESPAKTGDTITVTVTCNFASVIPNLFGPGAIPFPSTLTGVAAMRYE
jgi:Flp pilus assembly protein TadG